MGPLTATAIAGPSLPMGATRTAAKTGRQVRVGLLRPQIHRQENSLLEAFLGKQHLTSLEITLASLAQSPMFLS